MKRAAVADLPELLTISQTARACGLKERRLRYVVESEQWPGRLVQLRPAGRRYLRRADVEVWARLWLGKEPDYRAILDEVT